MANQATLKWWPLIQQAAARYGIDPTLLLGVVDFESSGNPEAVNRSSGATGLGQVMPREKGFPGRPTQAQLMDPGTNLEWAARILSDGIKRYGNEDKGLAAYLGAIDSRGNITGAVDANGTGGNAYIRNVRERQQQLAATTGSVRNTETTYQTRGQSQPRATVTIQGRRPPSRIAQEAAARAVGIAAQQRRQTGTQRASAVSAQSQAGQQRALHLAWDGVYAMPVDGTVTNPWGGKQVYSAGKDENIGGFNNGADIATEAGTDVVAPVGGQIIGVYHAKNDDRKGERDADENGGWGGSIIIKGDDGKVHHLSHAQFGSILVKVGQRVEKGQTTHKVGMTGNATGPHVDWERWDQGVGKGQSSDPLKAPLQSARTGAQAYQKAIQQSEAASQAARRAEASTQASAEADAAAGAGASAAAAPTGDSDVSQTAGNPNQPLITEYQRQQTDINGRLASARATLQEYLAEQAGLQSRPNRNDQQEIRLNDLNKAIAAERERVASLEDLSRETGAKLAAAQSSTAGQPKPMTEEERQYTIAQTNRLKAETAALEERLRTGGVSELEAQNIRSQIADRQAQIAQADRRIAIEEARAPSMIRQTEAAAGRDEWAVAESAAMLPYSIDRVIAQTDVDDATAMRIREMLAPELEKAWTEVWRLQQLTPLEVEQGQANAELTRQRTNEIRQMIGPNIRALLARAGVDEVNAAKIEQMLPLEMADLRASTQLRQAQTGKTQQETRLTQLQADAEGEKQRRWAAIEEQIRSNPAMTTDQVNRLVMGAATNIQDWATAYRTQLESQVAQNTQQQRTQELQINQQRADTERLTGVENAATAAENARTNQVNSLTSSLGEAQGPMRRLAQLSAAAPLVGVQGLPGVAAANRWGTTELNPVQEAFRQFSDRLSALRGQGGTVRNAPNVTAPPPIDIGFTPPTSSGTFGVAGPTASGMGLTPGSTSSTAAINAANAQSTANAINPNFTVPSTDSSTMWDEERRRAAGLRAVGGV